MNDNKLVVRHGIVQPWDRKDPIAPNFLQRLFRMKVKENARIAVENLLASKQWPVVTKEDIHGALLGAGFDRLPHGVASEIVLLGVRKLIDAGVSADQVEHDLKHLCEALDLSSDACEQLWGTVAGSIMTARWSDVAREQRLSPTEEAEINALALRLGLNVNMNPSSQGAIERFRVLWQVDHGDLPVVYADLHLEKGETIHISSRATEKVLSTRTTRVNYGGLQARVRIVRGLYYRAGSVQVERVTEQFLKTVTEGVLYLTSKRILLLGQPTNSTIRLSNVIAFNLFADAIEIEKASGKHPLFFFEDIAMGSTILQRLINIE